LSLEAEVEWASIQPSVIAPTSTIKAAPHIGRRNRKILSAAVIIA
jgi:hypothetical protein